MNQCETLRDDLKAYVDGELPMGARLRLRLHLARCPACRQEVAAMEQISKELRAADAGSLDPALRAKLLSVFPEDAAPVPVQSGPKWGLRSMQTWATAAGVLLICVVCYPLFQHARETMRQTSDAGGGGEFAKHEPNGPSASIAPDAELKNQQTMPNASRAEAPLSGGGANTPSLPAAGAPGSKSSASFGGGGHARRFSSGTTGSFGRGSSGSLQKGNAGSFGGYATGNRGSFGKTSPASPKTDHDAKPLNQSTANNGMASGGKSEDASPRVAVVMPRGARPSAAKRTNLLLEVDELAATSAQAERIVKNVNGTVLHKQSAAEEGRPTVTTLTLQIPTRQLDTFLDQTARLGQVKTRNVADEGIAKQGNVPGQSVPSLAEKATTGETQKQKSPSKSVPLKDVQKSRAQRNAKRRRVQLQRAEAQKRLNTLKAPANTATITLELRAKRK